MPLAKYNTPFEYKRKPPSYLTGPDVQDFQGIYNNPQTRQNLSLLATSRDPSVAPSPISAAPTPVAPSVLQQQPEKNWWAKLGPGGQSALMRSALAAGSAMLERTDPEARNPLTAISRGVLTGLETHDIIKEEQRKEGLRSRLAGISTEQPSAAYAGELGKVLGAGGEYAKSLEAFKAQKELTPPEKESLESIIAEEERKFGFQKELIDLRTGGAIKETKAGITARTEAAKGLQKELINQMNQLLDQTDLDEATKQKIKVIAQGGLGASVGAALFPRDEKDRIGYEETIDPLTGEPKRIYVRYLKDEKTGKFVSEEIKRREPEVKVQPQAAPEVPIQPPPPEPEPEVKRLLREARKRKIEGAPTPLGEFPTISPRKTKAKKLTDLKHVPGAPTLDEYLEFIANNPKNVNAEGDIIIPEAKLVEDYSNILEARKALYEKTGEQKALRLR